MKRALFALILAASVAAAPAPPPGPRILVGPNILVSRDGDAPHVELIAAANPRNSANLVGGAITYTRPKGGTACRVYASHDGGSSWKASEFPEQMEFGGGDPYTAFTLQGTALFAGLSFVKDEKDQTRAALHVYRSEDGGWTWQRPADLGYSYDFEKMTADQTTGRFAGRAYISVLYGYPVYRVGIFRSEDDGRTWTGPVEASNGGGTIGIGAVNVFVLADGTLVLPIVSYEFQPGKVKFKGKVTRPMSLVLSTDGGVTFGAPRKAPSVEVNMDDPDVVQSMGNASLAADTSSGEFKDRISMVWADWRFGRPRLLFAHSEDRGQRWSDPMLVDGSVPKESFQYQPVIAVNKDGVVGISWFDTRDSKDGGWYDEYFAASVDGGRTFLPSRRVSSASSNPRGQGNSTFGALVSRSDGSSYLGLLSAASRWLSGGDYMGLTVDKNGVFHPFWSDARTGTFQVYSAAVSVILPPRDEPAATRSASPVRPAASSTPRTKVVVDERVEFTFDPSRYDASTKDAELPVRLTNTSKEPIYPPITLEILGFQYQGAGSVSVPYPPMSVVNARNGKTGVGAVFDFSDALGGRDCLEPGGQTNPVVLKFGFQDPTKPPPIRFRVEGFVDAK